MRFFLSVGSGKKISFDGPMTFYAPQIRERELMAHTKAFRLAELFEMVCHFLIQMNALMHDELLIRSPEQLNVAKTGGQSSITGSYTLIIHQTFSPLIEMQSATSVGIIND
jgi:hypothetical protein